MGTDLRLLPFDHDFPGNSFSLTVLSCSRNSDLFDKIRKIPSEEVPNDFASYLSYDERSEEAHFGITTEYPDGKPVMYVLVRDLLPFVSHEGVRENVGNRAIWAYLDVLPERTKVALSWN